MRFLWFWVNTPDGGLELKHSIRSVCRHFQGECSVTVLGDRPKWYTGHHIHVPRRQTGNDRYAVRVPWWDTHGKIQTAAAHDELPEEFCWIMDDVFFLRDVTETDLRTPRHDPWYRHAAKREWHRLIAATHRALQEKGYPALQYGTHLPHVFEKQKLQQMFDEFDFPKRLLLFEILYGNRFHSDPQPYTGFLKRLLHPVSVRVLDTIPDQAYVLNYVSRVWRGAMQRWIMQRFSVPSPYEK